MAPIASASGLDHDLHKASQSISFDSVGMSSGNFGNVGNTGGQSLFRTFTTSAPPTQLKVASQPSNPLASELSESLQLITQTLLQISPSYILDPAKEHLSSSYISVPTPSISSLLTATKILNYIATNLSSNASSYSPPVTGDFDISELLQTVGDSISALAAQAGVDLVLSHADISSHLTLASGTECGLAYIVSHILRRLIATAHVGDSLEVGFSSKPSKTEGISCTIEFIHRTTASPPSPNFQSSIFHNGLKLINASFSSSYSQADLHDSRRYLLAVPLNSQSSSIDVISLSAGEEAVRQPFSHVRLASEPSLTELSAFTETLRGKKVSLHSSSSTPFAQYLTTNLTAWGMDVTHLSAEKGDVSVEPSSSNDSASHGSGSSSSQSISQPQDLPRFIIIDDDIEELRSCIIQFNRLPLSSTPPRRPPLVHRPKSHRSPDSSISLGTVHPLTILYFTSLTNYKVVREFIQGIDVQYLQSNYYTPEVLAFPKPIGPRRFLTALYTAANKPLLDPLFAPIATWPTTSPAFSPSVDDSLSKSHTLPELRPRPEKLAGRSPREAIAGFSQQAYHGSPLAMEMETTDYFSETDIHVLGQTPSSGMLIQSPNGQPAGIFFKPPASKPSRLPPGNNNIGCRMTERDLSTSRKGEPSIETLRRSARHLSDEILNAKSMPMPHPIAFLRSKTTPHTPGASNQASLNPNSSGITHHRKVSIASTGDSGSSRSESVREIPQVQTLSEDKHRTAGSANNRIKSTPPHPILLDRKMLNAGNPKMNENTIVPPINVLIVEDNPINQTILTTFMKRKKIKYDTAKDGQEAIDKYKSGNFHLILMDIQMPVMDGIEATREIRRLEAAGTGDSGIVDDVLDSSTLPRAPENGLFRSSVIIVALTASSLQSDRVNALAAGCNDFLTKPVSLVWLNNKIIEWGSLKALQMYAIVSPASPSANHGVGVSASDRALNPRNSTDHPRHIQASGTSGRDGLRGRKSPQGSYSSEGHSSGSSDEENRKLRVNGRSDALKSVSKY